jgi:hypothetical protein
MHGRSILDSRFFVAIAAVAAPANVTVLPSAIQMTACDHDPV